ncbi:hypothetical protein [Billgrantia endophytica]|uniref:Uncharacterized protein n=1 Tax=Billgrantia endophytica TaxID=2033802 RepID=A0A2N7U7M2_9GAMM|nr:hypothetical protein [Halomonas endophytica]PMR76425.1 hypothetical protein C1H69_05085 [Halomonas endophytica]
MNVLKMTSELSSPLHPDNRLARRLACAKARLDGLERDTASKDQSALAAARVEFSLASRALADALIAQGLHVSESDD